MEQEMNKWFVIRGQEKKQLEDTDLKLIKKNAQQRTQQSPQQTPPQQLNQTKLTQAKSFTNYLPLNLQTCPLRVFKFCLSFLGSSLHSLDDKVRSFHQRGTLKQQKFDEMKRTSRKRQALCFSSKWRQAQKILYLIVHKFISSQQQIKKIRIHILNHRGLILQTISNINQNNYFQDISRTILRHYRRLNSVVLFLPQNNVIDCKKLVNFFRDLTQYDILVIYSISRQTFKNKTDFKPQFWNHFEAEDDIFIGLYNDKQILVSYNSKLHLNKIPQILSTMCSIINRESRAAGYFQSIVYFSGWFCQRQFCLRFFAYLFNFITLRGMERMQPEEKQSLLGQIIELQINSLEEMQKSRSIDNLETLAHTSTSHQVYMPCLICKKRTKTHCQKCCLLFNKLFGLCEKQCFVDFHKNTSMYEQRVQKSKKAYKIKPEREELQQNEFNYQKSINGRKMRKIQQASLKINRDEDDKRMKTVQYLTDSWKNIINDNEHQYLKFQSYAAARLFPVNMFKKVEYIRHKLSALKSANAQKPQIKVQQNIENEVI